MQNGKLYGVVSGGLELATLNEYFKSLQDNYNYSIVAMDLTHNIVLSIDSNDIGKQTDLSKAFIEGNKQNNDGFIRFEYDGISNIALCSVNNKTNWLVCFVEDASIIDSAMSSRIFELAISLVILMVVLLILLNILVGYFLKPLSIIKDGIDDFFAYLHREKNTPTIIECHTKDELGQMSASINENIKIVHESFDKDNKLVEESLVVIEHAREGYVDAKVMQFGSNPSLNRLKDS